MDSSPMTQGAANCFFPKNESRTDMGRAVVAFAFAVVGAVLPRAAVEDEEEKAVAVDVELRVETNSSKERLWRGMICCF